MYWITIVPAYYLCYQGGVIVSQKVEPVGINYGQVEVQIKL